jgi:hypothetical protein
VRPMRAPSLNGAVPIPLHISLVRSNSQKMSTKMSRATSKASVDQRVDAFPSNVSGHYFD